MNFILLFLAFVTLSCKPVQNAGSETKSKGIVVDLRDQFIDTCTRDQSYWGVCWSFATIGLAEAAYFRQYGKHVRFSETDLIFNYVVADPARFKETQKLIEKFAQVSANEKELKSTLAKVDADLSDGRRFFNLNDGEISYLLNNGITTTKFASDYPILMATAYNDYKESEKKLLTKIASVPYGYSRLEAAIIPLFYNPAEHWVDLSTNSESARLKKIKLFGGLKQYEAMQKERNFYKQKFLIFKNYKFLYEDYSIYYNRPLECEREGTSAFNDIMRQIQGHRRPVSVSMNLTGLKQWGMTNGYHNFLIVGYRETPSGEKILITRNSWGGENPEVHKNQTCGIVKSSWIGVPKDN